MAYEKSKDKLKSYFDRCGQDTPRFFKKLRTIGLIVTAAGATLLASPVAIPVAMVTFGGYLTVAGAVAIAMSQAVIVNDSER